MKQTEAQVDALIAATEQLLDDMGKDSTCVCLFAKAKARIAYEPFRAPDDDLIEWISINDAKKIIADCENG